MKSKILALVLVVVLSVVCLAGCGATSESEVSVAKDNGIQQYEVDDSDYLMFNFFIRNNEDKGKYLKLLQECDDKGYEIVAISFDYVSGYGEEVYITCKLPAEQ